MNFFEAGFRHACKYPRTILFYWINLLEKLMQTLFFFTLNRFPENQALYYD